MNWDIVEGNWKQLTGKAKQRWGKLTDDDLVQIHGKREQLIGRIQERYGLSRSDADRELERFVCDLEGDPDTDAP